MIVSILRHTPPWVFALFAALVALGVRRLRAQDLSPRRLALLPVAMAGFSLFGLVQGVGAGPLALAAWAAAFAAVVGAASLGPVGDRVPDRTQYSAAARTIRVPGSPVPLVLMMTVFFTRYAVAVLLAMHASLRGDAAFAVAVALVYGLTSGAFAARAWRTWHRAFGGDRHLVAA